MNSPSTPVKFGLGTIVMGVAFLLFLPLAGGGPNSAPLLALVGILFVFTVAELLLSPVGLSLSTKLAPAAFRTYGPTTSAEALRLISEHQKGYHL